MPTLITTPHGTISIRPAQETDTQAFRDLRLEALQNHPEAFNSDHTTSYKKHETFWTERLYSLGQEGMIFFATRKDKLIGMCGIRRGNSLKTAHSSTIWGVYVQQEWRGLRIAEGFITKCTEWAQEQGIKIIKLSVVTTNVSAIRCYARCDFKVYGIEPQAICSEGIIYDDLLMARII